MKKTFNEKVVIITGAATGIGRATAIAFARQGANIVIADNHNADETLALIEDEGVIATYIKCNVQNENEVKALVEQTIEQYGRLDIAVNNAGIEGVQSLLQDTNTDNWEKTINTNLKGVFLCMKYELPEMLKNGHGAIVNIASIAGLVAFPNMAAYVASKYGVIGLTKTAALENAKTGIRINAVCPGVIKTPMVDRSLGGNPEAEQAYTSAIPMGRMGRPEEIADFILYLCSDAASYITGQAMAADGGWVVQ